MSKQVLVTAIAEKTRLPRKDVAAVLDALPAALVAELDASATKRAVLPGVCSISKVHKEARIGRNPQTGKPLEIAARDVLKLKPVGAVKKAVEA